MLARGLSPLFLRCYCGREKKSPPLFSQTMQVPFATFSPTRVDQPQVKSKPVDMCRAKIGEKGAIAIGIFCESYELDNPIDISLLGRFGQMQHSRFATYQVDQFRFFPYTPKIFVSA